MDNSKVHLCQPRGIEVQTLLPTASYYWSHQQQLRTGWNNSFAERRDTERSAPIVYGGLLWPIGLPPTPLHPCSLDNWCKTNGLHTSVLCCSRRTIPFPCGARNTECWGLVWGPLRHLLKTKELILSLKQIFLHMMITSTPPMLALHLVRRYSRPKTLLLCSYFTFNF